VTDFVIFKYYRRKKLAKFWRFFQNSASKCKKNYHNNAFQENRQFFPKISKNRQQ
jgi:hypothetical protein